MFTGIVEEVGEITEIGKFEGFCRVRIRAPGIVSEMETGSSIATNGVCITAREIFSDGFNADLSRETLRRTTLGHGRVGSCVNLERPMQANSRFGGHIVQGHVDGVGRVARFERHADDWVLEVAYDPAMRSRLVWKGSIAVDGISLTIARLRNEAFTAAIIPHTLEHTNLRYRKAGDEVNLEFDVLAKYVENLIAPYLERIEGAGAGREARSGATD